jgi:phosphoglycolate phosphatase-like HAD superfamily hydrolase
VKRARALTVTKLVLFDIDGTLLSAGRAPRRAISRALKEVYGLEDTLDGLPPTSFAGKTDPEIMSTIFARHEPREDQWDGKLEAFYALYAKYLKSELPGEPRARLCPGVKELLEGLRGSATAVLGVLTGNIEEGARIKLGHFGLSSYFATGSFGSDSRNRGDLPAIAVRRAAQSTGKTFSGKDVVIVGDTFEDIAVSMSAGARSVIVATGFFTYEDLAKGTPDFLFKDFSQTREVVEAILS